MPTPRPTPRPTLLAAFEEAGVAVAEAVGEEAVVLWTVEATAGGTERMALEVLVLAEVDVAPAVAVTNASPITSLVESLLQQSSSAQHHSVPAVDVLLQRITHSPPVGLSERDKLSPGDFYDVGKNISG